MTGESEIIERLAAEQTLAAEELSVLLKTENADALEKLRSLAAETAKRIYGNEVYIRGLIEFTNYCKNDCYYCGIRRGTERRSATD